MNAGNRLPQLSYSCVYNRFGRFARINNAAFPRVKADMGTAPAGGQVWGADGTPFSGQPANPLVVEQLHRLHSVTEKAVYLSLRRAYLLWVWIFVPYKTSTADSWGLRKTPMCHDTVPTLLLIQELILLQELRRREFLFPSWTFPVEEATGVPSL